MFSHYFTYILHKIQFLKIVVFRSLIILFRRRKKIEEIYFNYATEHIFENSYIVINYRFRNAIYYRFGKHKTLEKQIKIFDLKNVDKEFDFVVYGFFQKSKIYKLKFEPKFKLESDSFKTSISNLNLKLEEITVPKLAHSDIFCDIKKPNVTIPEIKIELPKIKVSNTTFNQNEFI